MKTSLLLAILLPAAGAALTAAAPDQVRFTGDPASPIASGVALPPGRALFWTSGTVPSPLKRDGATLHDRYGDTYAQGMSCLKNIEAVLKAEGLALKDVVYLRVYIAPDPAKGGKQDYAGWFKAYGEYFNNPQNPVKTARSTVGVQSLVHADWLLEIEAFAVYPAKP